MVSTFPSHLSNAELAMHISTRRFLYCARGRRRRNIAGQVRSRSRQRVHLRHAMIAVPIVTAVGSRPIVMVAESARSQINGARL